jgi:3-methyl-2-oxobutanoate hydroxymethyltransferase
VLRAAIKALTDGADAVLCTRRLAVVELWPPRHPVMGHLGFVPRKSTWVGRTRGVGKTVDEAVELWQRFRRLEGAGAFAVEAELVAAPLLGRHYPETSLVRSPWAPVGGATWSSLRVRYLRGQRVPSAPCPRLGDLGRLRRQITRSVDKPLPAPSRGGGRDVPATSESIDVVDSVWTRFGPASHARISAEATRANQGNGSSLLRGDPSLTQNLST